MKRVMTAMLLITLMGTVSLQALETKELVALAAMPLAVAAVADVTGVPTSDLVNVVTAMNRAAVPAPQFVEIVRYTPVALVDHRYDPPFVTYVGDQYDRGLRGDAFALSLADRLRMYDVGQVNVVEPVVVTPAYVVRQEYIPTRVVTRVQQVGYNAYNGYGGYNTLSGVDPLALIAMPLAVAAVSELAGVPQNDLFSLIASLNQARVPAPQFVEIVRYSPVVLIDQDPTFVRFVRTEVDRGVIGPRLVRSIDDRFRTIGYDEVRLLDPAPARIVIEREEFVPPIVVRRIAERRAHPHGGPPGQLKRDAGVQTGAEIVHTGRTSTSFARRSQRDDDDRFERNRRRSGTAVTRERPSRERAAVRELKPTRELKPAKRSSDTSVRKSKGAKGGGKASVQRAKGKSETRASIRSERSGKGRAELKRSSGKQGGGGKARGKGNRRERQ